MSGMCGIRHDCAGREFRCGRLPHSGLCAFELSPDQLDGLSLEITVARADTYRARQRCVALEGALRELVTLKDVLKKQDQAAYHSRREAAWDKARAIVGGERP